MTRANRITEDATDDVPPVDTPPESPENTNPPSTLSSFLSFTQGFLPLGVAIFLLLLFGWALIRMFSLTHTDVPELQWGRNVYLFGGLEALAFSAAGFLFGREVNRQRAEKAEKQADSAQRNANVARAAAATNGAKGNAMADIVRALNDTRAAVPTTDSSASPSLPPAELKALRRVADSLFPAR